MVQVRENCFETNSSSVHTLCICSDSEYSKWAKDWNSITSDSYLFTGSSLEHISDVINDYNEYDAKYHEGLNKVAIEDILNPESPKRKRFIDFAMDEYYTEKSFFNDWDYEPYCEEYTSPSGDKIVAFGHYGYNG